MAERNIVGIYKELDEGEKLEVENPSVSIINFEKGGFFGLTKKYDTCVGKIYLTNKRILLLKLIMLEASNMKVESADQFEAAMGQWFDVIFEHITNVSTPKQGFWRGLFKGLIGEKKEGLEVHYQSPLETEKKKFFGGVEKVRETYVMVFTIDNKELWSMKLQTLIAKIRETRSPQMVYPAQYQQYQQPYSQPFPMTQQSPQIQQQPPSITNLCPKCNREVSPDFAMCPFCGQALKTMTVCKKCGKELQSGFMICPFCGTPK